MSDILVIIPTYNEIENIGNIIDAVMSLPDGFDILVIDDASPDGTQEAVREKIAQYPDRVHMETRTGKLGLGTAYIHGFRWALDRSYDYVVEMDADFSHNPADLPRLYHECKENGADVAVGSRYISGVNVVNWPMGRVLMSYFASVYVRMITRMDLRDSTAGFVCYRSRVLRELNLDKIQFKGYAFQIEMKFKSHFKKFKIVEVPIVFVNRQLGTSKMNTSIFGEAIFGVITLKMKSIFKKKTFC
ncbi:polyprenol monophosphomannose synthase [uncultured Duncaniella sp.]|jgi:dolichol-phosphate mannosyltransferase|uniref:polyprenol monophosphomannose synthase n=1 Tax=uncultured Duncaniella sp. TaxID=2768039 RepID=UPI0025B6947F|nr:polyprenol monophosphomannose synthase [uncultured Duncaniella sp.]